jgi:AraC family transcriptional regulator of arabinose operon
MAKTADSSAIKQAARTFYQWFHGAESDDDSLTSIQSFLGSPISIEELRHLGDRLRNNEAFIADQAPIIEKWRGRMESSVPLREDEAQALIQEMFESFDHALLYESGIKASSTLIERGQVSDSDMRFPGSMPCWTLHLTLGGTGLFLNDHMEQYVQTGDMMLLRPDASYHCGLHPMADHWEHLWALFQPRPHWRDLLEWRALDDSVFFLTLPDDYSLKQLEESFRGLIALGNDSSPYQNDLQHNNLEELLIKARNYSAQETSNPLDRRVQQACDYMQSNLTDKFSLDEVASACNLSTSRLSHLFQQQIGLGPKAWINNIRLQQARKRLLNSEDSINTIGAQVGYDDPSHFSRYFKKNMGCSPRQFRQSFR